MNEKINITKMDGTNINADIICFLENTNTNKRYLYYTLNEIVGAGAGSTVKIYVSKIKQENPLLDTPITEEDWDTLKKYMGDSLKGVSNAEVKYLPLAQLGNPINISELAIAMPTSYDYINKQRGLYAQSIANDEGSESAEGAAANMTPVTEQVSESTVEPATSEPVPMQPAIEPLPVEPTPVVSESASIPTTPEPATPPAPVVEPTIAPATLEPSAPIEEVTPPSPVTPEPTPAATLNQVLDQKPVEPVAPLVETPVPEATHAADLKPIDLKDIESKYNEMISQINQLKEQELEAAKRYNATLELNSMHTEQHTNYVQNDIAANTATNQASTVEPTVAQATLETSTSTTPQPAMIEPSPVTPVVPEPVAVTPQNLETNWFDMPANN